MMLQKKKKKKDYYTFIFLKLLLQRKIGVDETVSSNDGWKKEIWRRWELIYWFAIIVSFA